MSNSGEYSSAANQPAQPESFENRSHVILTNPLEVDLNQPDRAMPGLAEVAAGFEGSKLVAEIQTPNDKLWVLRTQLEVGPDMHDAVSVITVVGKNPNGKLVLEPGIGYDVSDTGEVGKCVISLDESGSRVFVHADDPDQRYRISTRELEQYEGLTHDDLLFELED